MTIPQTDYLSLYNNCPFFACCFLALFILLNWFNATGWVYAINDSHCWPICYSSYLLRGLLPTYLNYRVYLLPALQLNNIMEHHMFQVAQFLRVNPETGLFYFDSSYRPVPLAQQYIGISERDYTKKNELFNNLCYEKVFSLWQHGSLLISAFVPIHNPCVKLAGCGVH
jgi:hypothetical protein